MIMVGDRGMITIGADQGVDRSSAACPGSPACAPRRSPLAADDGPLQMSLFDTQDLAEISHPDYPGERLVACRNPALAQQRARKRDSLLAATETLLDTLTARVSPGQTAPAPPRSASPSAKYSTSTRWPSTSPSTSPTTHLTYTRNQANIDAEAALDGIYVIRTPLPADRTGQPRRRRSLQSTVACGT